MKAVFNTIMFIVIFSFCQAQYLGPNPSPSEHLTGGAMVLTNYLFSPLSNPATAVFDSSRQAGIWHRSLVGIDFLSFPSAYLGLGGKWHPFVFLDGVATAWLPSYRLGGGLATNLHEKVKLGVTVSLNHVKLPDKRGELVVSANTGLFLLPLPNWKVECVFQGGNSLISEGAIGIQHILSKELTVGTRIRKLPLGTIALFFGGAYCFKLNHIPLVWVSGGIDPQRKGYAYGISLKNNRLTYVFGHNYSYWLGHEMSFALAGQWN